MLVIDSIKLQYINEMSSMGGSKLRVVSKL